VARSWGRSDSDILDSLARGEVVGPKRDQGASERKSGGDALDSLVGGGGKTGGTTVGVGGSGRSHIAAHKPAEGDDAKGVGGQLARVDEETSDLGDQSLESRHSRSGSRLSPGSKSKSPAGAAAPDSPQSLSGPDRLLEVSASINEVSMGADYSVEDSCELDKCDFVEEVRTLGPLQKQVAATAKAAAASADGAARTGALHAEPKASTLSPLGAASSGATAKAAPAAGSAAAGSSPVASPVAAGRPGSPTKGKDAEYDDDFDNMSMSVPESICEESVASGDDEDA